MRATATFQARKGRLAGEVQRAFLASGFVLVVCALAAAVASQASMSRTSPTRASGETNLSTGSMLFVSPSGDLCRERTIDNSTWQIRNKGWVDCDDALAKAAGLERRTSGSRLDIIRESFRGKN
jgi:hypothetical protein